MSTTTQQHIGAATRLLWSVSPIVDIARDGWPKKLHVQAIAALQSWRDGDGEDTQERKERQADWVYAIKGACTHSKTPPRERRVLRQSPMVIGGEVVGVETVSVDYITAQDFFAWLTNQQEAASPLLQLWFKAQGVQAAQPQAAAPALVVGTVASSSTKPDPERRLARLRELGGNATYNRGEWRFPGITALVASEKSEGRKRCDEKTIRADLKEAAESEREAKRASPFAGLAQG